MEDPFFVNHWNPVRRSYFPQPKPRPSPSKPKVVSIPVHFVGSDDHNKKQAVSAAGGTSEAVRSAAAVKIQKVCRGFLVRNNLRTLRRFAAEAEEVARRIEADEEAIRRDAKERLRVGEMLMSLLLRLDSVRGVREYRKKVIRRVISLQEAVDSISDSTTTPADRALDPPESMEMPQESKIDAVRDAETLEIGDRVQLIPDVPKSMEDPIENETLKTSESAVDPMEEDQDLISDSTTTPSDRALEALEPMEMAQESNIDAVEDAETLEIEDRVPLVPDVPKSMEEPSEKETLKTSELAGDPMEETQDLTPPATRAVGEIQEDETKGKRWNQMQELKGVSEPPVASESSENPGMKEVMERMAAENEQLKGMVAELCERSAQQCCLMGGLAERVKQLERAVQQMKRKKKKREAGNARAPSPDKKSGGQNS